MLGFDTLYRNDYQDDELISISLSERRALLTRDLPLLKKRQADPRLLYPRNPAQTTSGGSHPSLRPEGSYQTFHPLYGLQRHD
jgi:hypothetical protein